MFDYQPTLSGALLAVRPVTSEDWDSLFALGGDPAVWEIHPQSDRYLKPRFRDYFEEGLASGGALVAVCHASGAVAGWSRYSAEHVEPGEIEIGWTFLGRAYWGGPYNADLKRVMLAHAFRFVDQVIFRIGETNLRSRRAAEKIGAHLTGRSEVIAIPGGDERHLVYAISRQEFLAVSRV